jgi:hypothetical protein
MAQSDNNMTRVLLLAAFIAAAVGGTAWTQATGELQHFRIAELMPIAALLKDDQEILQALRADSASEKDYGILASYLAKIRADGLLKQADVKQKLDRLAENNSAIVALINVYSQHMKTASFSAEADKFRRYAIAWRDRWNSVMELFMAGGNYPVAEVPFPLEFVAVVQTELETAKHAL